MQVGTLSPPATKSLRLGEISGGLFVLLGITVLPYLISIHPDYEMSLSRFSAMTSLQGPEETAGLFNLYLKIQSILLFLYFMVYFSPSRTIYSQMSGWKAVNRLHVLGCIGIAGVGFFPENPQNHILHISAAAFAFGGITFSLMIMSFNFLALSKREGMKVFRIMGIFGISIMVMGLTFTSVFIFINVNQGLWQNTQMVLIYVWYLLENYYYKTKVNGTILPDMAGLATDGLQQLRLAIYLITLYGLSLVVLGIFGFIDIDILSKCNEVCQPKYSDYQTMFGFGLFLVTYLTYIRVHYKHI